MMLRQLIPILAIALTLAACEGTTTREWIIQNNSSEALHVEADIPMSYTNTGPHDVSPNTEVSIGMSDQRGGNKHSGVATNFTSSMLITTSTGDTIMKDPLISSHWLINTNHRSSVPSNYHHEYRLVIVEDDL